MQRHPRYIFLLQLVEDIGLGAVVVRLVLGFEMDNEEDVHPQVVLLADVLGEAVLRVAVELRRERLHLQFGGRCCR